MRRKKEKGFTLIELLVVIAIISILSSILLTNVSTARSKANDSRRLQEVTQIETALELARNSLGHFPCHISQNDHDPDFLKAFVDAGYLPSAPRDPSGGYYKYEYATLKDTPDPSRCGDIVFLGVYYENPGFRCPRFGMVATDGVNHCHIWYPHPPLCKDFNPNSGPIANTGAGVDVDPVDAANAPCLGYGDTQTQF